MVYSSRSEDEEDRDLSMLVGTTGINNSSYLTTIPEDSNDLGTGGGDSLPSMNLERIPKRSPQAPSEISSTKAVEPESVMETSGQIAKPEKKRHPKPSPAPSRKKLTGVIIMAIVFVVAVATATLRFHGGQGSDGPSSDSGDSDSGDSLDEAFPSVAPSESAGDPFLSYFLPIAFEQILVNVSPRINYEGNYSQILYDPNTPQGKARNWLRLENAVLVDSEEKLLQRYALLVFFFSTSSPNRTSAINYLAPNEDECEGGWFQGAITCDGNPGNVIKVQLKSTNTTGILPNELSLLTGLRELLLSDNGLEGPLPSPSSWKDLYFLDLANNALTGTIPVDLWSLPIIRFTYLFDNKFSGSLPAEISSVAASSAILEDIWLYNNELTGILPYWIARLTNLRSLSAASNSLSGPMPSNWEGSESLFFVDLSSNEFTGALPESLLTVETLEHAYLENNQLSGALPTFPVGVSENTSILERLWLQNNSFTGEISADFGAHFGKLQQFKVHNNPTLTGTLQCDQWPNILDIHSDCISGGVTVVCDCDCIVCY